MLSKRLSNPEFWFVLYRSNAENAIRILKKPVKCAIYTNAQEKHGQKIQNKTDLEKADSRNEIIANDIAHFAII